MTDDLQTLPQTRMRPTNWTRHSSRSSLCCTIAGRLPPNRASMVIESPNDRFNVGGDRRSQLPMGLAPEMDSCRTVLDEPSSGRTRNHHLRRRPLLVRCRCQRSFGTTGLGKSPHGDPVAWHRDCCCANRVHDNLQPSSDEDRGRQDHPRRKRAPRSSLDRDPAWYRDCPHSHPRAFRPALRRPPGEAPLAFRFARPVGIGLAGQCMHPQFSRR